jgi:hypothetical protein
MTGPLLWTLWRFAVDWSREIVVAPCGFVSGDGREIRCHAYDKSAASHRARQGCAYHSTNRPSFEGENGAEQELG